MKKISALRIALLIWVLAAITLQACKWGTDIEKKYLLVKGKWRAAATTEAGVAPFIFELELIDSTLQGRLHASDGLINFSQIEQKEDSLLLGFGDWIIKSQIRGNANDSIRGILVNKKKNLSMDFYATAGGKYKFIANSREFGQALPLRWQVGPQDGDACYLTFEESGSDLFMFSNCQGVAPNGLSGIKDKNQILLSGINARSLAFAKASLGNNELDFTIWSDGLTSNFKAQALPPLMP